MKIILIADAFPPLRSSAAIQLRDLSLEFIKQGHKALVVIPSWSIRDTYLHESMGGVDVLWIRAPCTKDVGYVRRTLAELLMPIAMLLGLRASPFHGSRWDGVVWYSPSIFHGPMIRSLKRFSSCRSYLILRDVFPEWAVDMGLMGRGLPYRFFKAIEMFQYSVADVIGVQTPANTAYLDVWAQKPGRRVEVLQNWLANATNVGCSITLADGALVGRTIFVYAGNMGVAQGMDVLLDVAERLRRRTDVGFLFVGRGSEAKRLREDADKRGLDNVAFFDEIDPTEIPGLYAQCHIGIVALDPRHKTHNIPGKFLSYMQAGLPVLASVNPGNDLVGMIEGEGVGRVSTDHSVETLQSLALELVDEIAANPGAPSTGNADASKRCKALSARLFLPGTAVRQIVAALAD
jgi:glycosyltransferase involved in cell wall biosynthesis